MNKWTHDGLAEDLATHIRGKSDVIAWTDMQLGPSGSRRPDVYTINKSYSRFVAQTYEVKISVSDFRSDITSGKWQEYLKFSSAVTFAVPAGLISKDDIPAGCGLIVRGEHGWRYSKAPTLQKLKDLPHEVWMKLVIDGMNRELSRVIDSFSKRQVSAWFAREKINQRFGRDFGQMIAKAVKSPELIRELLEEHEEQIRNHKARLTKRLEAASDSFKTDMEVMEAARKELAEAVGAPNHCYFTINGLVAEARKKMTEQYHVDELRDELERLQKAVSRTLDSITKHPANPPQTPSHNPVNP